VLSPAVTPHCHVVVVPLPTNPKRRHGVTTTPTSKSDRPSIEELELDLVELECTLEAIDEELRRGMTVTPA